MNMFINPADVEKALAEGMTADQIAAQMSEALNKAVQAQKEKAEAREAKRKAEMEAKAKVEKEATAKVVESMKAWMFTVIPEAMALADEKDLKDLDELLETGLIELKKSFQATVPMLKLMQEMEQRVLPIAKEERKNGLKKTDDPIAAFLAQHGL